MSYLTNTTPHFLLLSSKYLVATAAAVICLSLTGCIPVSHERYRDDLVVITEHSVVNLLNVHASTDTEVLKIFGHSFEDVRGGNPCYLAITNKHLILFVTGKTYDHGQAVVHLADTTTHQIRDFPAYDSQIGSNIGSTETNRFERVLGLDGNKLVVEAKASAHYKYFIDLSEPRFEREEMDVEDVLSNKTIHHVYENGKFPRTWQ